MKGISRIDSGATHGWFVRGYRNRKTVSKFFADRKHGGKGKALLLAKSHRDELHADIAATPKAERKRRVVAVDSRNSTGEIGVALITRTGGNGVVQDYYIATWRPEPNQQRSKSFSVSKYGKSSAFERAKQLRRKMMREIHGPNFYRQQAGAKRKGQS